VAEFGVLGSSEHNIFQATNLMTPYSFALTVFRMVAVGLVLQLLYSWVVFRFLPVPGLGSGANLLQANMPQIMEMQRQSMEMQQQVMVRGSFFTLGSAVFLYFFAPLLARVVTI
jgi:hypothetical protein